MITAYRSSLVWLNLMDDRVPVVKLAYGDGRSPSRIDILSPLQYLVDWVAQNSVFLGVCGERDHVTDIDQAEVQCLCQDSQNTIFRLYDYSLPFKSRLVEVNG